LLQVLQLQGCGLDDRAVGELVDALKVNSSLKVLVLSQNSMEDIGGRALGQLLRLPGGRLKKLDCSGNQIGTGSDF
jgi:Ran GTPase-activating protein (RanGAP) involved in mRNA processing and transport